MGICDRAQETSLYRVKFSVDDFCRVEWRNRVSVHLATARGATQQKLLRLATSYRCCVAK